MKNFRQLELHVLRLLELMVTHNIMYNKMILYEIDKYKKLLEITVGDFQTILFPNTTPYKFVKWIIQIENKKQEST